MNGTSVRLVTHFGRAALEAGRAAEARDCFARVVEYYDSSAFGSPTMIEPLLDLAAASLALDERDDARHACMRALDILRAPNKPATTPYRHAAPTDESTADLAARAESLLEVAGR